jgi:hypothetical protein
MAYMLPPKGSDLALLGHSRRGYLRRSAQSLPESSFQLTVVFAVGVYQFKFER